MYEFSTTNERGQEVLYYKDTYKRFTAVLWSDKMTSLEERIESLEDAVFGSKNGDCDECGRELDENGYCVYPCPNCD